MKENFAKTKQINYFSSLALLFILFFIWGAITSLNDILVPHFKGLFSLNYTRSILLQFCFFGAYFLMSVPASLLINRIGYKKGIVTGLLVIGFGCLLFYPAASFITYGLFLFALFTIASGMTILQVVANPYVAVLGNPKTASSRLNLAQGINSLGTTLAPMIGAYFILNDQLISVQAQAKSVQGPYIVMALFTIIIALVFGYSRLPGVKSKIATASKHVLKFRQLRLGALAIFFYVGAEVTIGSFLISYIILPEIGGISQAAAAKYVSLYWGGAMVGRFVGSALLQKYKAQHILSIHAVFALILVTTSLLTTGYMAVWSIVLVGLANSIMWSNIFTLAIDGLGEQTIQGSGILCMMPIGGAIIPLLQGFLADNHNIGLHVSFAITIIPYTYILFYGLNGFKKSKV